MSSAPGETPADSEPAQSLGQLEDGGADFGDIDDIDDTTDPGVTRLSRRPPTPRAAGLDDIDHTLLGARPRPAVSREHSLPPDADQAAPLRRATVHTRDETIVTAQLARDRAVISGTHVPNADRTADDRAQRLAASPAAPGPLGKREHYAARPAAPVIAARAERREPGVQPTVDPSKIDHATLDRTVRGRARRRAVGVILVVAGSCLLLATAVLLVISTFGH